MRPVYSTDGGSVIPQNGVLADLKPEAAYFGTNEKGERTAYLVIDLADSSKIPGAGESLFLAFNAAVEVFPVMTAEDLMKAGPDIGAAVQKYAS